MAALPELPLVAYQLLVRRIQAIAVEVVRPGGHVLVASHGDHHLLRLDGRSAWHFPRHEDGSYAGHHPADSESTVQHLESLVDNGGGYFLLPAHSFWWRDHYPGLFGHLDGIATIVWADESCLIYRTETEAGGIDVLARIDDGAWYAQGWLRNLESPLTGLTAVSPAGERTELLGNLFRRQHPDFADLRCEVTPSYIGDWSDFIARFETEDGSQRPGQWRFELEYGDGGVAALPTGAPVEDAVEARRLIVQGLPSRAATDERLMSDHVFPAVSRLQERASELVKVAGTSAHGRPPESPDVSLVVPVYSRLDLVEHQIAQFTYDPELREAELVYVLDSPELGEWAGKGADELQNLYRIPLKVLVLERPSGYAAATNAGAEAARGRLLVLLNSDVLPDRPGWLGKLKTFYDSTPGIGALGAKLVYEDESLQHAGMYFQRLVEGGTPATWVNRHYFKGLGRHFPAADVARPVAAVTAACLMIDRRMFLDLGGLTDVYVQGDFEDSDLCLRLLDAGHENWYLPEAELYHAEGQSYDPGRRARQAVYNRWLHTRRHGGRIEAAAARFPPPAGPQP